MKLKPRQGEVKKAPHTVELYSGVERTTKETFKEVSVSNYVASVLDEGGSHILRCI